MQDKAEWSPSSLEEKEQGSPVPTESHKTKVTLQKLFAHYNTSDLGTGHAPSSAHNHPMQIPSERAGLTLMLLQC